MDTFKIVIIILAILVILTTIRRENFTETFGFSGYKKPVDYVKLYDPSPDFSSYSKVEANVDHDMMEQFVIQTNKELFRRLGFSTYIIETQSVKSYESSSGQMHECTFMVVRNDGFSFGFAVIASFEVVKGKLRLVSLRSQPLKDQAPDNVKVYTKGSAGKEFIDYKLVNESAIPKVGELDSIKNKLS
jgi:hypothetical protein